MTIRRGTLYAGVFLLAAGAVAAADAAGLLDPAAAGAALVALWPIAVIAVGVALLLRRSPAALVAGIVAAALPGLALGASVVAAPAAMPVPCSDTAGPTAQTRSDDGTFAGDASVRLELDCGHLGVTTAPGTSWNVERRDGRNRSTEVTSSSTALAVRSKNAGHGAWRGAGRVDWDVTLPTGTGLDLATTVNAGRGELALGGARLGDLELDVNAGALRVDLATATLERLDLVVNAGDAAVILPASSFTGEIEANAAAVRLCAPAGLGLRVSSSASLGTVHLDGLVERDGTWETPDYATAPFKAELAVDASLGTIEINPQGGCK